MSLFDKQTQKQPNNKPNYNPPLTKEECVILLTILQETTFKGKDIVTLYQLINKIEEMYNFYES